MGFYSNSEVALPKLSLGPSIFLKLYLLFSFFLKKKNESSFIRNHIFLIAYFFSLNLTLHWLILDGTSCILMPHMSPSPHIYPLPLKPSTPKIKQNKIKIRKKEIKGKEKYPCGSCSAIQWLIMYRYPLIYTSYLKVFIVVTH